LVLFARRFFCLAFLPGARGRTGVVPWSRAAALSVLQFSDVGYGPRFPARSDTAPRLSAPALPALANEEHDGVRAQFDLTV
jgi:hypothetical protein